VARGRELEGELAAALRPLEDHPLVSEVRAGTGLMAAVDLDSPSLVPAVYAHLREEGVLTRALGGGLAFSPPLTIRSEEIELIGSAMRNALDATLESTASPSAAGGRP
jgi:putrescine aminotransferase